MRAPVSRKERILVVDDEKSIVETLRMILEMSGYAVHAAVSGQQAIATVEEGCPDLLLSDVMMPGLNGFETALRIKQRCPGCRLLFFSGYANSPEVLHLSENLTAQGYEFEVLAKPLHPSMLLEKVHFALRGKDDQTLAVSSAT
jgi:CheY-like chemotaxis protein